MAKYKWDNLILFSEQLATAAQLQLPLDKTIASMSRESYDSEWALAQESVSELVRLGSPLSDAMDNYPAFFPGMMRRLIRIGEEGGILARMLHRLSRYIQDAREIQHQLQKCLIYPLIVWTLLMVNLLILFIFVIPKLYSLFESIHSSQEVFPLWFLSICPSVLILGEGILLFLAWILIGWLSADLEGRPEISNRLSRVIAYLPFIGAMQRHARSAETCEVLGILVEGGHDIRQAIGIAKQAMNNASLHRALEEVDTALVSGEPFETMEKNGLIPPTSLWMISETGGKPELGITLQEIARYHRRQVEMHSSLLRELIEPILIFITAVLGGLAIIGFYASLFQLSSHLLEAFTVT